MTLQAATEQYGMYLLPDEQYVRVFTLLRDKMLFTDKRIVFIDHQGATGVKEIIESISLDGIRHNPLPGKRTGTRNSLTRKQGIPYQKTKRPRIGKPWRLSRLQSVQQA